MYADWDPLHLSLLNVLYITPTSNAYMQELVMQEQKQKLYKDLFPL